MIAETLYTISALFALLGAIGFFRFPDFYTRIHAATMITIGGACLALASLAISTYTAGTYSLAYTVKIILIIIFICITSPASSHALAHAAYTTGIKPKNLVKNDMER